MMEIKHKSFKEQIREVAKEEPNVRLKTVLVIKMWLKEYFQGFAELTGNQEYMHFYEKEVQPLVYSEDDLFGFAIADEWDRVTDWTQGETSLMKKILIDPFCKL